MKLYEKYGLPKEYEMYTLPIEKFLEKNPSAQKFLSDPPNVSKYIKKYEAIIPINITIEYIKKRRFNTLKAFRELIQNALDETELVKGKPDVMIYTDDSSTWIRDSGRGISGSAFIIGTSEKECWMRGYYGEGLKLALGFFLSQGYQVYVFSNKVFFKPILFPEDSENPTLYVLLGESNINSEGTSVVINDFVIDDKILTELISFKNPHLRDEVIDAVNVVGDDCRVEKPYVIYDYPNKLYIRNLLIGDMKTVTKRPSFFSYDIWWFRLDVSRELLTYSMPLLFLEIGKIFERSDKAREKLAKKLVESGMVRLKEEYGGTVIEFSPIFGIFEGHLFVYMFPKGVLEKVVEALNLGDRKNCIRLFTEQNTPDEIREAIENGIIPFIVSSEIADKSNLVRYKRGEKCS